MLKLHHYSFYSTLKTGCLLVFEEVVGGSIGVCVVMFASTFVPGAEARNSLQGYHNSQLQLLGMGLYV